MWGSKGHLLISTAIFSFLATQTFASGYKMEFQSASVLADGGDAAVVEDAGTNWYNSAGLVYLPQQLVLGGMHIYQKTVFKGSVTAPSIFAPGVVYSATGRASTYNNVDVPAFHYVFPCGRFAFGLTVAPAWGLIEDYGDNSILRYDLARIYTRSMDIAPSIAYRISDQWSIGLGPDYHYWYLSSRESVRTTPPTATDSVARFSGDNWAWGGHIGILWRCGDRTRIGLNYRSRILMKLEGHSAFAVPGGPMLETGLFRLNLPTPAVTTLSAYQAITPCWALMGTVAYDQWHTIRYLHAKGIIAPPRGLPSDVVLPQHFRNTFDFALGTHYQLTDKILLRTSVRYEQSPVKNAYRDVNFPDSEKIGLNFGGRYQMTKCVGFDLLYAHVFTPQVSVHRINTFGSTANGHLNTNIDIVGGQIVWSI